MAQAVSTSITRGNTSSGLGKIPMKIAQNAPLIESVPPRLYGGPERIVLPDRGGARP